MIPTVCIGLHFGHNLKHRHATVTARAWDEQLGAHILEKLWKTEHMKSFNTPD